MIIGTTKYAKIMFIDGGYYIQDNIKGTIKNIFLYKFKRIESFVNSSLGVTDVSFDYDMVILDELSGCYLYFTFKYIDEPEEIF